MMNPEDHKMTRLLASYVPKLVLKQYQLKPDKIQLPHNTPCHSALVFADISGFTPLTEKMSQLGKKGIELMSTHLNHFFDKLIELVHLYGGDIIKFAGDAVMVVWPDTDPQGSRLPRLTNLACQCAMALQQQLHNFTVEGCVLRLHIGIACGELGLVHVGGEKNRMEFLITGQPLEDVSECEKAALPGEVYVSREVVRIVEDCIKFGLKKKSRKKKLKDFSPDVTAFMLLEIKVPEPPKPSDYLPTEFYSDIRPLLIPYAPPAITFRFSQGEKASNHHGEMRIINVIFVNLDYIYISGERELSVLQEAVVSMQRDIYQYDGTVRQFLVDDKGSVLIGVFGTPPNAHEDDASRAVMTAISIQKNLLLLGIKSKIGITTGEAFLGDVGNQERREYAVVGDIVNLSARLMGAAPKGQTYVDQATFKAASSNSRLSFTELTPIMVKGKSYPIPVYRPNPDLVSALVVQNTQSKALIGRTKELKNLQSLYDATLKDGSQHVVVLQSDAGLGKSHLIQEFVTLEASKDPQFKFLRGVADSVERSTPFFCWSKICSSVFALENEVRLPKGEASLLIQKKITEWFASRDMDLSTSLPCMSLVLGIDWPQHPQSKFTPEQAITEIEDILLLMLKYSEPKVIVIENLQWQDEASWGFLPKMIENLTGKLIVLLSRPVSLPHRPEFSQISAMSSTAHVTLSPLEIQQLVEIVRLQLKINNLPTQLRKHLEEQLSLYPNPLLAEEIADQLYASGVVVTDPETNVGVIKHALLAGLDVQQMVPSSLRGIYTAKVDGLTQSQQLVVKLASVIGRDFSLMLLYDLLPSGIDLVSASEDRAPATEDPVTNIANFLSDSEDKNEVLLKPLQKSDNHLRTPEKSPEVKVDFPMTEPKRKELRSRSSTSNEPSEVKNDAKKALRDISPSPESDIKTLIESSESEPQNSTPNTPEPLSDKILEKVAASKRRHSERPTRTGRRSAPIGINLLPALEASAKKPETKKEGTTPRAKKARHPVLPTIPLDSAECGNISDETPITPKHSPMKMEASADSTDSEIEKITQIDLSKIEESLSTTGTPSQTPSRPNSPTLRPEKHRSSSPGMESKGDGGKKERTQLTQSDPGGPIHECSEEGTTEKDNKRPFQLNITGRNSDEKPPEKASSHTTITVKTKTSTTPRGFSQSDDLFETLELRMLREENDQLKQIVYHLQKKQPVPSHLQNILMRVVASETAKILKSQKGQPGTPDPKLETQKPEKTSKSTPSAKTDLNIGSRSPTSSPTRTRSATASAGSPRSTPPPPHPVNLRTPSKEHIPLPKPSIMLQEGETTNTASGRGARLIRRVATHKIIEEKSRMQNIEKLRTILNELIDLELLQKTASSSSEKHEIYEFKHAIFCKVIRDTILPSKAKTLHSQIAVWYEANRDQAHPDVAKYLASHWRKAECPEKAIVYYASAAERDLNDFKYRNATTLILKAILLNDSCFEQKERIEVIKWHRQLGESYYNFGEPLKSLQHLSTALRMLNEPPPSTILTEVHFPSLDKFTPTAVSVKGTDARASKKQQKTTFGKGWKKEGHSTQQEIVRTLLALAQVYLFMSKKSLVSYCTLRALACIEIGTITGELCRAIANNVISAGLEGQPSTAAHYMAIGDDLFPDQRRAMQCYAIFASSQGNWETADSLLKKSSMQAYQVRDFRSYEESQLYLSFSSYWQGNLQSGSEHAEAVLKSAGPRADLQMQALAYLSQANILYSQGKIERFFEAMDSFDCAFAPGVGYQMDVFSQGLYHGLMAVKHFKQSEYLKAYNECVAHDRLYDFKETHPSIYFSILGFYYSSLIRMCLFKKLEWQGGKNKLIDITQKKFLAAISRLVKNTQELVTYFKVAKPIYTLSACYERRITPTTKQQIPYEEGVAEANKGGMYYFEAIFRHLIGVSSVNIKDTHDILAAKANHREKALELFSQLDVFETMLVWPV